MNILGIDLGGTQVRAGKVSAIGLGAVTTAAVRANDSVDVVVQQLASLIEPHIGAIEGIGVGVPSLVDPHTALVRDVPNLPAWRDVPLEKILRERFELPVHVLNDANAFVLGEHIHGAARGKKNVVGLTLGTGTGCGILVDGNLVVGHSGGAGELGMLPYLEHTYEHYTSSSFFRVEHATTGEATFAAAENGDVAAQGILADLGHHVGNLCLAILCALDPEMIVLGGSISHAWKYFEEPMRRAVHEFPYPSSVERLVIAQYALENPGVVGAAMYARDRVAK